jgi:hypothetical protein
MPELDVRSPARPPPDSKTAAAVLLAALAGASLGARAVAVRWVIRRGADLKIGMAGRRAPAYVLGLLPRSKKLPFACPRLLPRMSQPSPHWETSVCLAGRSGCLGLTCDVLDLVDAGNGERPPMWSHINIYAGNLHDPPSANKCTRDPKIHGRVTRSL